jgi:O-antigen ligase
MWEHASVFKQWPENAALARRFAPPLVACSIVVTALASSGSGTVADAAAPIRWVVLGAIAAAAVVAGLREPSLLRRAGAFHAGWLAFVALAFLSASWSVDPYLSVQRSATLLLLSVAVIAGALVLVPDRDAAERWATWIVIGIVTVFVISAVALVDWDFAVQPGWTVGAKHAISRFRGVTENPNTIASYGPLVLPLLLWQLFRRRGAGRWLAAVAIALVAAEVTASLSRVPVALMAGEALVFTTVFASRGRTKFIVGGGLVCGLAATVATAVVVGDFGQRVVRQTTFRTAGGRTAAWHAAAHLIDRRPLTGTGFGTEQQALVTYRNQHPKPFEEADISPSFFHNSYLGLAVQVGVAGAALLTVLLLAPCYRLFRRRRESALSPRLAFALVCAIVAAALQALFSSYFYSVGNVTTVSLWILASIPFAVRAAALPGREERRSRRLDEQAVLSMLE